jgi:hypothetical protein
MGGKWHQECFVCEVSCLNELSLMSGMRERLCKQFILSQRRQSLLYRVLRYYGRELVLHAGHKVIAFRKGLVRIRLFFYPSLWVYLDQLASLLSARWTSRLVTCPTPKCVASRQQLQPIVRANVLIYDLTLESTRIGCSKIDRWLESGTIVYIVGFRVCVRLVHISAIVDDTLLDLWFPAIHEIGMDSELWSESSQESTYASGIPVGQNPGYCLFTVKWEVSDGKVRLELYRH